MLKRLQSEIMFMFYFGKDTKFHLCCILFSFFHLTHSWIAFVWVREQVFSVRDDSAP